ncbi:hypothetical protein F511_18803 [Dorcoceras hygrometricum]|uniref:Uncharacterized protein n=1 Tax=Dorcoceras hygrometricum TaxID=472368 RepID=A0A2Z7CH33_9LAMI|nr:hypothetical protein F511_18803 [Dorcoceras hygrometricum]
MPDRHRDCDDTKMMDSKLFDMGLGLPRAHRGPPILLPQSITCASTLLPGFDHRFVVRSSCLSEISTQNSQAFLCKLVDGRRILVMDLIPGNLSSANHSKGHIHVKPRLVGNRCHNISKVTRCKHSMHGVLVSVIYNICACSTILTGSRRSTKFLKLSL